MLIEKDSILFYLPKNLRIGDLLILDSLRFSIEMIDYNYQNFLEEILKISYRDSKIGKPFKKDIIPIFINCWSVIDNFQRFIKLYQILPSNNNHALIKDLLKINSLRNTFQHLDERIKECLFENEMPFYGVISWEMNFGVDDQMSKFFIISGLFISHKKFVMKIQKSYHPLNEIVNISLQTYVNKGTMKNPIFSKIEFSLSDYLEKARLIIKNFEINLENQFLEQGVTRTNWSKRRDVILKFNC